MSRDINEKDLQVFRRTPIKSGSWHGTYPRFVGRGGPLMWVLAATTVGGSLLLWGKIQKLLISSILHFRTKQENTNKVQKVLNDAYSNILLKANPMLRRLIGEVKKEYEAGYLDNMSDMDIEDRVEKKLKSIFDDLVPIVDRELEKIIPKIRNPLLSQIHNDLSTFLFTEGYTQQKS